MGLPMIFIHINGSIGAFSVSLIAEVGCMGFHMFSVPPCHSWCRYGSSLCVP